MGPQAITTVVTAASTYDLTTLAVVKEEVGVTGNDSNTRLQRYLTAASAAIAQYCNRVIPAETLQDDFWLQRDRWPRIIPGGVEKLQLSRWQVASITSVTENAVALVENTDFRVDKTIGQLIRLDDSGYPKLWPVYPISVVYVGGFSPIPTDIADAAVRMVRMRWQARNRDPLVRQETVFGVREVQYWIATGTEAGNMPPDVTDILDNYRVPVIA